MADKKILNEEELKDISGGMVNWDGSYSFYAGQIVYLSKNRKQYVVVKEASNFVGPDYQVPIEFHSNIEGLSNYIKTISAAALQEALDENY